jgi:hypothetical protein
MTNKALPSHWRGLLYTKRSHDGTHHLGVGSNGLTHLVRHRNPGVTFMISLRDNARSPPSPLIHVGVVVQPRTLDGTPLKTRRLYTGQSEMFCSRGEHMSRYTPRPTHAATTTGDYIVRGSICMVQPVHSYNLRMLHIL